MAIRKANRPCVMGVSHAVAAGHYMAARAGLQMLEAGGNAIDAGVAAGIATAVLEGVHVSFGGVTPILIRLAERGHDVQWWPDGAWPAGSVCMIHHDLATGVKSAADFRRTAYAVGW